MKAIDNWIKRIDFVLDNMEPKAETILKNNEPEIIKTLQGQLFKGVGGTGEKIQPSYTPFTIKKKKTEGQPFNRVTMKDKGNFYKSLFLDKSKILLRIGSTDFKAPLLKNRYGGDSYQLSPINKKIVAEETLKKLSVWAQSVITRGA
ncbi:MAG: hypothetical protein Aureis2KO_17290 [Aureisphaera sp.]